MQIVKGSAEVLIYTLPTEIADFITVLVIAILIYFLLTIILEVLVSIGSYLLKRIKNK